MELFCLKWILNARVYGYARVYDKALVSGNAQVSGNTLVYFDECIERVKLEGGSVNFTTNGNR